MIGIYFPISGGKFALVDRDLYEEVIQYKWQSSNGYVNRHLDNNKDKESLHQFVIFKAIEYYIGSIDHKNTDRADCRRENLRVGTQSQNVANSKPKMGRYKGVRKYSTNCFRSRIMVGGREINLGSYYSKAEAADTYDNAAIVFFGEFANLNCSWLNQ